MALHINIHTANTGILLIEGILANSPIGKDERANTTMKAGPANTWYLIPIDEYCQLHSS